MTLKRAIGRFAIPRLPLGRFAFEVLRAELRRIRVRWTRRVSPMRSAERARLRSLDGVYANVACGPDALDGFVNLDLLPADPRIVAWDCADSLPFADGSCAGVRAEHFVEHLEPRTELPRFLASCLRVLRPAAVLRVVVPDAEAFVRAYCAGDSKAFAAIGWAPPFPHDLPTRMDVVNHVFHQWHEHRWAYDFETLAHRLEAAGFVEARRAALGESLDPALARDLAHHAPYSLYVDARKPARPA